MTTMQPWWCGTEAGRPRLDDAFRADLRDRLVRAAVDVLRPDGARAHPGTTPERQPPAAGHPAESTV